MRPQVDAQLNENARSMDARRNGVIRSERRNFLSSEAKNDRGFQIQ